MPGCGADEGAGRPGGSGLATGATAAGAAALEDRPVILFLGDSLTAGYGLQPEQAYPALLQERIAEAGQPHLVVNAGVSGDTTASGARRIDWLLRRRVDVLVLALGGNDGLRGIAPESTRAHLQTIIDRARLLQPGIRIVVAGMQAPPNMGWEFTSAFRTLFADLARANDLPLVPFLLEGVGGVAAMNQRDGIHPNAAGQRRVADNVAAVLLPLLPDGDPALSGE